jgi:hypothetical protein
MKNDISRSGKQKKVEIAMFISDKVDLKPKLVRGDKGDYILIKETFH